MTRLTMGRIIDAASRVTSIARDDITGPCRRAHLVRVRAAVVWVAAQHYQGYGALQHMARALKRNHNTVLHSKTRAAILFDTDPTFRELVRNIWSRV